jgi:hypothetical protein
MRTDIRALGLASGLIAAATYVVCGLAVAVAPGSTSSFIGGLVLVSVFVGVCVAATAWLYKKLAASGNSRPA